MSVKQAEKLFKRKASPDTKLSTKEFLTKKLGKAIKVLNKKK